MIDRRDMREADDNNNLAFVGSQMLEWHGYTLTRDLLPPEMSPCWTLTQPRGHQSYVHRAIEPDDAGAHTAIDAWREFFGLGQVDNPAVNLIQCVTLLDDDAYQIYMGVRSQWVEVNNVKITPADMDDLAPGHPRMIAAMLCRAWWESVNE